MTQYTIHGMISGQFIKLDQWKNADISDMLEISYDKLKWVQKYIALSVKIYKKFSNHDWNTKNPELIVGFFQQKTLFQIIC